jgi:hypothetical protein
MTRFVHDQFAQEYLPHLLANYGIVTPSANITAEIRQVDVLFTPTNSVPITPETLGLLGKLVQQTCLLEIFRNPVQPQEITSCAGKLFDYQNQQIRQKKREQILKKEEKLPFLWLISPTVSGRILEQCGAEETEEFGKGIYICPPIWHTGIVVVHKLPIHLSTLWLRILGRGKVQKKAILELKSLSSTHPYRDDVLELIYNLLSIIEANRQKGEILAKEDQEFLMKLSPIYLQQLEAKKLEGLQEGRQEGRQEGQEEGIIINLRANIISLLEKRFHTVSPELVSRINSLQEVSKLQQLLLETISVTSVTEFENLIDN